MRRRIFKFGGVALSEITDFEKNLAIIKSQRPNVVVVSAIGATTNALEELTAGGIEKKIEELKYAFDRFEFFSKHTLRAISDPATFQRVESLISQVFEIVFNQKPITNSRKIVRDSLLGFGEKISSIIFSQFLRENGFENEILDAEEFIITDLNFGKANIKENDSRKAIREKLIPLMKKTPIITQGFIGRGVLNTPQFAFSVPTTLGRESSDLTATFIARVLKELGEKVDCIVLWKDVDGVAVQNPRFFPEAPIYDQLSYAKAKELVQSSAQGLIFPRAVDEAEKGQIDLFIKNYNRPSVPGTIIH